MYIEHADWLTLANTSIQIASIFGPLIQGEILNHQWGYILVNRDEIKKIRVRHATMINPWEIERNLFNFIIDDVDPEILEGFSRRFFVAHEDWLPHTFSISIQMSKTHGTELIPVREHKLQRPYPARVVVDGDTYPGVYEICSHDSDSVYLGQLHLVTPPNPSSVPSFQRGEGGISEGRNFCLHWRNQTIATGTLLKGGHVSKNS